MQQNGLIDMIGLIKLEKEKSTRSNKQHLKDLQRGYPNEMIVLIANVLTCYHCFFGLIRYLCTVDFNGGDNLLSFVFN
jgi:hypothetical protein